MDNGEWLLFLFICAVLLLLICAVLYLIPRAGAVVVLTLLLGWTFVGWVVAVVWALVDDNTTQVTGNTTIQVPPDTAHLRR